MNNRTVKDTSETEKMRNYILLVLFLYQRLAANITYPLHQAIVMVDAGLEWQKM
jgi:hypothetical protein